MVWLIVLYIVFSPFPPKNKAIEHAHPPFTFRLLYGVLCIVIPYCWKQTPAVQTAWASNPIPYSIISWASHPGRLHFRVFLTSKHACRQNFSAYIYVMFQNWAVAASSLLGQPGMLCNLKGVCPFCVFCLFFFFGFVMTMSDGCQFVIIIIIH